MLPEGAYYCFEKSGDDPLVLMRIATMMSDKGDPETRLGVHQQQIDSHTAENRRPQQIVYRKGEFYEYMRGSQAVPGLSDGPGVLGRGQGRQARRQVVAGMGRLAGSRDDAGHCRMGEHIA